MKNSRHFWRGQGRQALTLVEVVASLVLLATLMAGVLVSFGKHQRQLNSAEDRLQAVQLADDLLQRWGEGAQQIPANQQGVVRGSTDPWLWRTQVVQRHIWGDVAFDVIRLQILRPARSRDGVPLAQVEVLVGQEQEWQWSP